MTPLKFFSTVFLLVALIFATSFAEAAPRDRDRGMQKQRGHGPRQGMHGNERSLRPQRVQMQRPNFGGNGCPDGTMSVVFAPDFLSFSILYSAFTAETAAGRDGITCDALIPVEIPAGMQMEITRVDFRGFANLPANSRAVFRSVFNFRENRNGDRDRLAFNYQFQGPLQENYTLSSDAFANGSTETSPCGGSVNLRVLSQLQVISSRNSTEPAMVTLDSADGSGNAVYYVNWKACGQPIPQPPPPPPPPVRPTPPHRPQPSGNPAQCYLQRYPDICQNSKPYCKDPAAHYRNHGQAEGRNWGCQ